MNAASKETMMTSNQATKMFTYEFPDVDSDLSIFPAPEDDVLGVEHFLQPDYNKCFPGSVLDFNTFHSHKCLSIENFSFAVEFDQIKIDSESLHSSLTLEGERTKQEVRDEKSKGTDDVACSGINKLSGTVNRQTTDDIFNLAPGSCNASFLGNVDFGYPQGFCSTDLGVDLSFAGGLGPKPLCDWNSPFIRDIQLKNSLSVAGHNVGFDQKDAKLMISSSTGSSGCSGSSTACLNDENMSDDRPVKRKRLSSCDSSKINSEHIESKIVPFNEGNKVETLVTEKRLRKPPRRYSEESIEQKSRSNFKKSALKASKDKSLPSVCHRHQWQKKLKAAPIVPKDKSFNGGCIQVPFGLPIEEGHSTKKRICWEPEEIKDNRILCIKDKNDVESFSAESEDENTEDECVTKGNTTQKGNSRRKHHISWTLSEVMKLVEGVSKYGVGRWTEIKRLQFSSSSHRTSVDLKDKWRNLLKASDTQLQNRRKVVLGRKQALQQVPESVLCRVRELAAIYPYPRENKSKETCSAPTTSSFKSSTSNMLVCLPTVM
ncbi:uncharacterized protein LOC111452393 isoform X1 [Cucurbita moschata]|uniref:Uncharacterized protein LOC111452393 isoform X1 n=1 Tax=Cucurbita moschata TaxID=3662 RepID=A0A6J1GB29_CUCMO|nr:uncharacterized protein LOC111452393 isoform X1 [Cucurbita moschata]